MKQNVLARLDALAGQASAIAREIEVIRQELIVSESRTPAVSNSAPRKRSSKPRYWNEERLTELSELARRGLTPAEISGLSQTFDKDPVAIQAQMYLLFPKGNRQGINFK